jgi:hypothetical protein
MMSIYVRLPLIFALSTIIRIVQSVTTPSEMSRMIPTTNPASRSAYGSPVLSHISSLSSQIPHNATHQ